MPAGLLIMPTISYLKCNIITINALGGQRNMAFFVYRYRRPSDGYFLKFFFAVLGRHLQLMDDEARLVFDTLDIASEGLSEKSLDVGLKLLPSFFL